MRYLFVFLLVGLVSCGDAPITEKNNTDARKKQTQYKINGVNRVDTTLNMEERIALEPKIYHSVKIGELEVMTEDLGILKWEEANERCSQIPGNWRLPTIRELELLHENMDSIGGFKTGISAGRTIHGYWSSEEYESSRAAYYFNFSNAGHYKLTDKAFGNHVRAVRTIK